LFYYRIERVSDKFGMRIFSNTRKNLPMAASYGA